MKYLEGLNIWYLIFVEILLLIGIVSAVDVNFDCPNEVVVNKEFICSLDVSNGEGIYDVKVYIRGDDGMINRIWVNDDWQRTDWYAKSLIENGETIDVKLKIDKEFSGVANGDFKLRKNGATTIVFSDSFSITVNSEETGEESNTKEEEIIERKETAKESEIIEEKITKEPKTINYQTENPEKLEENNEIFLDEKIEIISLNSEVAEEENLIYVSKDARVVNYLAYGFSIFLIFVVGILIWERQ